MSRYKDVRNNVTSLQGINSELEKIAETQEGHLSRKGDSPNHMESDLDMNGQRVYNLPEPQSDHEPLTFRRGREILDEAQTAATEASNSADEASDFRNQAQGFANDAEESASRVDLGELDEAVEQSQQSAASAFNSQQAAATSYLLAGGKASQAVEAADRAETAAEQAAAAGRVYESSAAGQADVNLADGDYFWVVSDDSAEVLELWRKGAATATDTGKRTITDEFVFNKIGQELTSLYDKSLVFKSSVDADSATPVSPAEGDCYYAKYSENIFGIDCGAGQLIIRDQGKWRLGDYSEINRERGGVIFGDEPNIASQSDFSYKILISPDGSITPTPNFSATHFIPIKPNDEIEFVVTLEDTGARSAFYDEDFNFIRPVSYSGDDVTEEIKTDIAPANAKYIRFSKRADYDFPFYARIKNDRLKKVVTEDDFVTKESLNLARESTYVYGQFIGSSGEIATGAGWVMLKIPVEAGDSYSFGNFSIGDVGFGGYSAFYDDSGNLLEYNGSYVNTELPKTVAAPSASAFLYIDIARPTNVPSDYEEVMVNKGVTLLSYVSPSPIITRIKDYLVGGAASTPDNYAELGQDATFANLSADQISAAILVANLPSGTTEPAGIELNQAWIDTTDNTIKVKLS